MDITNPCKRCGCLDTVLADGMLFCSGCNEQIEEFYEVGSDEDELPNPSKLARLRKTRTAIAEEDRIEEEDEGLVTTTPGCSKNIQSKKHGFTEDENLSIDYLETLLDMECISDETVGGSAVRVRSFCKILCKTAMMMSVELGFPEKYPETVRCVTQRYLQKCGVAFVENEYTEDTNKSFKKEKVVKRSKTTIAANLKRLKLEKKKKGISKLEKSQDAWSFLQESKITENFELSSESDQEIDKSMQLTRESIAVTEETNIHSMIRHKAETFYIGIDAVVAILFISAIATGCLWVTLSDIIRWMREDRSKCFGNLLRFDSHGRNVAYNCFNDRPSSLIMSLSEYCRVKYWLWQLVEVDTSYLTIPFTQIIARYLFNLNLPTEIMPRILALVECAPPSEKLDSIYLTQQGGIKEASYLFSDEPKTYLSKTIVNCFGKSVMRSSKRRKLNVPETTDVFISTETKILAFVLLALKLVYGLNGEGEHKIKDESFDPVEWIYQLKMRIMIYEGHAVEDIINETQINNLLTTLTNIFTDTALVFSFKPADCPLGVDYPRAVLYNTLTPSITPCESAFDQSNPLQSQIMDRLSDRNDDSHVYAPLRAQAMNAKKFMNEIRSEEQKTKMNEKVSANAYKILIREYGNKKIGVCKQTYQQDSSSKWRKLFPSSKSYTKYCRPEWAQGMTTYLKETDDDSAKIASRFGNRKEGPLMGRRSVYLTAAGTIDLFRACFHDFSPIFAELLELLSKTISEQPNILYAAFVMLETQILEQTKYKNNCKRLANGDAIAMAALRRRNDNSIGCPTYHTSISVRSEKPIKEPRELRVLRFARMESDCEISDKEAQEQTSNSMNETVATSSTLNSHNETTDSQFTPVDKIMTANKFNHLYEWSTFWQLLTMRYW